MSIYTPDETTLRNLSAEIEATPPRPHHSALLEIANRIRPGCTFRYALNRGGWYRPGGVIAADGTRIADSLEGLLELYQLQVRLSAEMGMLTVSRLDQDEPAVLDVLAILARLRAAAE